MQQSRQKRAKRWRRSPFVLHPLLVVVFSLLVKGVYSLASPSSTASTTTTPSNIIQILYAGKPEQYPSYQKGLLQAFQEIGLPNNNKVELTDDISSLNEDEIDYIIYNPSSVLQDFSPYTNVKAVLSLRAGVDQESKNPTLSRQIPLTRLVDPGLRQGMVEYVVGHTLRYHLRTDILWQQNQQKDWISSDSPLAQQCTVGILGLGELGGSCADALLSLGFNVWGWSRTKKEKDGVACCHGHDGLDQILQVSDILVLLLPNTPETQNLMCQKTFLKCKPGVCIINAGRGNSIQDDDLLQALKDGTVAGATLDVFNEEPLPKEHPYWGYPNVLVTPHIAAKTRPETASKVLAENICRSERGEQMLYIVDRDAGY